MEKYIPEEENRSKTKKYSANFSPDSNPDEDTYKSVKENMTADGLFTISEYLLYPSELRKHFIEINIGATRSNWVFDLFTPEQKSKHLDIVIANKNTSKSYSSTISPKMMEFMTEEQKNKLYQKNIETGKGLSDTVLKLLNPEQINAYIRKNVETYGDEDISPEIFNLLSIETKLHVITHCGLYNLVKEIKDWYDNYQKGLKREEQIKSVIDES